MYDSSEDNPPGSSVCGILQARILEWVDSLLQGNLPNPGTEPTSASQADHLPSEPPGKPRFIPSILEEIGSRWLSAAHHHSAILGVLRWDTA